MFAFEFGGGCWVCGYGSGFGLICWLRLSGCGVALCLPVSLVCGFAW